MNRRVELRNDKEIATTFAVPGAVRNGVGRKIRRKIPRKTCVQKLVNKCDCLIHNALFNRKPMQFLKHKSYTGVSTVHPSHPTSPHQCAHFKYSSREVIMAIFKQ